MANGRQPTQGERIATIAETVRNMSFDVKDIKQTLGSDYVTKDRFDALQSRVDFLSRIIYGLIAFLLLTFGTFVFNLILGGKK